jgi:hypothetical protein
VSSGTPAQPGNGNGIGIGQFFDRVLGALENSVRVQTRVLVRLGRLGTGLKDLTRAMENQAEAAREGRDHAVGELKDHVSNVLKAELAASTRWERRFLIVVGVMIVLSNLVGQPVGQFLERVFHIAR